MKILVLCLLLTRTAAAAGHFHKNAFFEQHPPTNMFLNSNDTDVDDYGTTEPFLTSRVAVHIPANFRRHDDSDRADDDTNQTDSNANHTTTLPNNEPHISAPWPRTSWAGSISEFVYYFDGDLCHKLSDGCAVARRQGRQRFE